jgi:hypothetical protein
MDIIGRRRAEPTEDLFSILVNAEVEGQRMSDDEIVMETLLIFVGGDETTRHVITGDQLVTVANDLGGSIVGDAGSGVNLDTASTTTTSIFNHGFITGHSDGVGDGDGVDVDGVIALTNDGTITATGHTDAELAEAVTIGGGSITNLGIRLPIAFLPPATSWPASNCR